MGIIIRQTIRNSLTTYLGIVIGIISTLILFPIILGPEKYGLTRSIIALSTISSQLLSFGLPSAILKYLPNNEIGSEVRTKIFFKIIRPTVYLLIPYIIFFFIFKDNWLNLYNDSILLAYFFWLIIPLLISNIAFTLLSTLARTYYDTVFATTLQEVVLRVLTIIWLILFYFSFIDFSVFMYLFIGTYFINFLALLSYCYFKKIITFTKLDIKDVKLESGLYLYSFYVFMSGFAMIAISNIDLIMVDIFKGLEFTGIYALAMYIGAVINVPRKSLSKILHPIISHSFSINDMEHVEKVYKQSSINQLLFSLLIFIGIVTSIKDLFYYLPAEFAEGSPVIIILGLAYLFDLANGANSQIIITSNFYKFDFISSILLLIIAILLNYFLIPKFGINGAAISTATSIFLFNSIRTLFVWYVLKIQPFKIQTLYIILVGVISYLSVSYINLIAQPIISIIIRSIIITTIYLGLAYKLKLSPEFNTTISEFILKIRSKNTTLHS